MAVVGDALVDVVDGRSVPGGAALNVAVGLARLGADVDLVAMVADDEPGRLLVAHAASHGVRLAPTPAPLGTATATATRDGDTMRYVFNEAGVRRHVDVTPLLPLLDAADLVVVSCMALDDASQAEPLLRIAEPERRLVVDPNPRPGYLPTPEHVVRFREAVERIGARSRVVKVGDEDAELVWGTEPHAVASRLLSLGAAAVLVTEGPDGATAHARTASIHAPIHAMDAPIVDTIGAGDATIAAVAAALAEAEITGTDVGEDWWREVLDDAMAIAAATCRVEGGLLQLPAR
ncbi:carbohydrate kinase family protein [Agrococcus jejuensis]|uniref:Fructokinase n=1 Tax=Agrococcus jejuensis TaxID=399736 RepID=A0A1G8FRL6_9MICO|nr:PfkB family carbohydrate kinase [Agrococcus jejuensis]SDH84798.1 fructokinase [Agrococcus jejuensis]